MDAQLKLATFLMLAKQFEDARAKVDLVLNQEPNNVDALLLLAGLQAQGKSLFEAESTFRKVIEMDSQEARAYLGLGRVLAAEGKFGEVENVLMQAAALDPQVLKPRLALFSFYVTEKKLDQAEVEIKKIVADHPDNAELFTVMGNFYFRLAKPIRRRLRLLPTLSNTIWFWLVFTAPPGTKKKPLALTRRPLKLNPKMFRSCMPWPGFTLIRVILMMLKN